MVGGDQNDQERCEHPVLHIANSVAKLPEREAVEDANDDCGKELAVNIGWVAPLLNECTLNKHRCLQPNGCGKYDLFLSILASGSLLAALTLDSVNLCEYLFSVVRVQPFVIPIDAGAVLALDWFGCRFEDKLGNVLAWRALDTAVTKVFDNVLAIFANRTEVKGVAARVESQDHIELLNKNTARLVNGTDNSLTGGSQLLQEGNN